MQGFSLKPPFAILMELAPYGPLHRFIAKPDVVLDWNLRLRIALDVASAMRMLHQLRPPLLHREYVFFFSISFTGASNLSVGYVTV